MPMDDSFAEPREIPESLDAGRNLMEPLERRVGESRVPQFAIVMMFGHISVLVQLAS
jgi:hypothetical protein